MKVVTRNGTVIKRYARTGVGKLVGHHLYLYIFYLHEVVPILSDKARKVFRQDCYAATAYRCCEDFKCAMVDLKTGKIRFDEAPDFNCNREPHVGKWVKIDHNEGFVIGHSNAIWHHKWLWVKDDYPGFDVAASEAWSALYAPLLQEPPSGSRRIFEKQLKVAGLTLDFPKPL